MPESNILMSNQTGEKARAVLISLKTQEITEEFSEISLDELEKLLETAGGKRYYGLSSQGNTPTPPPISVRERPPKLPILSKTTVQ